MRTGAGVRPFAPHSPPAHGVPSASGALWPSETRAEALEEENGEAAVCSPSPSLHPALHSQMAAGSAPRASADPFLGVYPCGRGWADTYRPGVGLEGFRPPSSRSRESQLRVPQGRLSHSWTTARSSTWQLQSLRAAGQLRRVRGRRHAGLWSPSPAFRPLLHLPGAPAAAGGAATNLKGPVRINELSSECLGAHR